MAITSPDKIGSDETKTESTSNNTEINETKENNVPEYTKKSKVNKKRYYRKHRGSSKVNTAFVFASSGIPNPFCCEEYSSYTMPIFPTAYPVLTCYPEYLASPLLYDWSLPNSVISNPIWPFSVHPLSVFPPNLFSTQVCPYVCPLTSPIWSEPMLPIVSPIFDLVSPFVRDFKSTNFWDYDVMNSSNANRDGYIESLIGEPLISTKPSSPKLSQQENYPIEFYLTLPKELFPTANMLAVDPNPLIDEICKQVDINKHISWMLDLEFGVPRFPVTRPIAIYDVQRNNINCKNTPGAIHPGFESCNQNFKNAFLFYYDCVISAWYRGYMLVTADESVANFQHWLQFPMHLLGMCWP